MVKQLYDPHMFNYMWESIVPDDNFIVGTYYLEDTVDAVDADFIDHLEQVQRLALEGSTASWMDVSEETPELREKLSSKVLGYYEIPAPHGTKKAVIQMGFSTAAWDTNTNVPMLLLSIAGNCFAFPTSMRLLDIYIPKKLAERFQGPKFGVPGIREMLGVYDRPLVLHIIKPKMGMTPEETAAQVYQTALGGADLCKDDEMCTELDNCPFDARLEKVLRAIDEAQQKTGRKMLYMVSITDEVDRVLEKARRACRDGASGLLLAYSAGPSMLQRCSRGQAGDIAGSSARFAHAGSAPYHQLPGPIQDLPPVRRGHDADAGDLVEYPGGLDGRVLPHCADDAGALLPHQANLAHARRRRAPRLGRADAGRARHRHDLHGRRRHAGPSHGLHRRRHGLPPGHRRSPGRRASARRCQGPPGAARRPGNLGLPQTPAHTLGVSQSGVSSEVWTQKHLSDE